MDIRIRIVGGDFWMEDGVFQLFASAIDASDAVEEFLEECAEADMGYSDEDIEVEVDGQIFTYDELQEMRRAELEED